MEHVAYAYYRDTYHGRLSETDFNRLSPGAAAYLELATFGRICGEWREAEAVKNAFCAVADAYRLNEQGGGVASESNDGVTVNYISGVSKAKTDNERLYEAAYLHLAATGLMARGVRA